MKPTKGMSPEEKEAITLREVAEAVAIDTGKFRVAIVGRVDRESAEVAFGDFIEWQVTEYTGGKSTRWPVTRLDDGRVIRRSWGLLWVNEGRAKRWLEHTGRRLLPLPEREAA